MWKRGEREGASERERDTERVDGNGTSPEYIMTRISFPVLARLLSI